MGIDDGPRTLERRTVLRRAGVVVGATAWSTPVVQSISSPAFATGSGPPQSGLQACLSGRDTLVGTAPEHLASLAFTIEEPLCCGQTGGRVRVTTTSRSGETRDYTFDDVRDPVFCFPEISCTECPSGSEGEVWGTGPEGNPARLFFSFENNDPQPGQRGEPMDNGSMSVEEGPEEDPTLVGANGPASGAVMNCDSC